MKKILSSIILFATLVSFTGCEKYLDVNKNVDAPDHIDAGLYLPGILSAYQGFYWDIRALGPLSQMMGTSSYTTFATNYYSAGSDAGGEMWRVNYFLDGMNLENMINQAIADEAWTLAGIGYVIKAFSWDCIAKINGQAPLKQVYEPGRLSFDYDSDKDIMEQVRAWAETGIEYLEKEDEFNYGNYLTAGDLAYGGKSDKWIKLAHSIIVSDLAALTNKKDFKESYAQDLLDHAALAFADNSDNFAIKVGGGGSDAQFGAYNNFWGTFRGNLTNVYFQSDYIVQIMTGTVPQYDPATGDKVKTTRDAADPLAKAYPYALAPNQVICDTTNAAGHYDPRAVAKLSSADYQMYDKTTDKEAIKDFVYYGSSFTSYTGPISDAPNLYGFRTDKPTTAVEGSGRWIFRDDAPYFLLTASEVKFELAEALFKLGRKAEALDAWKEAIALDMDFTASYLNPGKPKEVEDKTTGTKTYVAGGDLPGGSAIAVKEFKELAQEYLDGPYVAGVTANDLTLSHIMMQKYVALWPWGAMEAWTDLRKYHYDIKYTGEYPGMNNGWTLTALDQKMDTDASKVYKGFYLAPAQVEGRKTQYNERNQGSPCYRIRPRYNSEYMWNKSSLDGLKPIAGTADNYHCSMPWFAYPGEYPDSIE